MSRDNSKHRPQCLTCAERDAASAAAASAGTWRTVRLIAVRLFDFKPTCCGAAKPRQRGQVVLAVLLCGAYQYWPVIFHFWQGPGR